MCIVTHRGWWLDAENPFLHTDSRDVYGSAEPSQDISMISTAGFVPFDFGVLFPSCTETVFAAVKNRIKFTPGLVGITLKIGLEKNC